MANNSWSDLPIPILNLITERLPYYDFVRSAAVCKTWQQAFHDGVQARCKNPSTWVMNHGCFNHDGEIFSILELSDPSTKQTYSIGDIITQEVRELFVDAKPCASRYGWLLLTKKVKVEDGSSTKFFFYNPFQNKVIELSSPLILTNKIARHKATFTASPTTSRGDCAVFVVSKRYNHVYVLSTYKLADRTWRTIYITDRILPAEYVLDVKAKELAYMDGILFCTFHSKPSDTTLLGAFNVALEAWDMIDCSVFANKIRCSGCNCDGKSRYVYYLVEVPFSKVFLVAHQYHYQEWHAFEYGGSDNKWFEVESFIKTFENRALIVQMPSSVAIEEFSDEFKGQVVGKYSINWLTSGFKTNCKPACDIFKEFARLGDFLTKSLIQLVPEVSIIHKHAHDDDTQILSPPLLPQPSASLLVPVEEDMTMKEIESEMESKMELEMKRKKDRNDDIRYDYDMQYRSDRKWKKKMEMQREVELEREREREIERERERERERQVETERGKEKGREREHKRERRRKKVERKRERELEREMERENKRMAKKRREKQEMQVDIQKENKRERRRKKREMKREREMGREVTWDKMGLKLSESKSERVSESEVESELTDNHILLVVEEQDLVPSSPPHFPQTPKNAVPVVEERRRDKDNKRAKKQRKKARRNTMKKRDDWRRWVVSVGLEVVVAAGCIFCILFYIYLFILSR